MPAGKLLCLHLGFEELREMLWPRRKRTGGPKKVSSRSLSNHWTHISSVYGPSDLSFKKGSYPDPKPMSEEDIDQIIKAFVESVKRAEKAECA